MLYIQGVRNERLSFRHLIQKQIFFWNYFGVLENRRALERFAKLDWIKE